MNYFHSRKIYFHTHSFITARCSQSLVDLYIRIWIRIYIKCNTRLAGAVFSGAESGKWDNVMLSWQLWQTDGWRNKVWPRLLSRPHHCHASSSQWQSSHKLLCNSRFPPKLSQTVLRCLPSLHCIVYSVIY